MEKYCRSSLSPKLANFNFRGPRCVHLDIMKFEFAYVIYLQFEFYASETELTLNTENTPIVYKMSDFFIYCKLLVYFF